MRIIQEPIDQDRELKFVVMGAKYKDQWLFVRHRERSTWEIPGGHLEKGESPAEAARRELFEETGATALDLTVVCDYAVERDDERSWGRLFAARVYELGDLPESEIAEIQLAAALPDQLTYPAIQPTLFRWLEGSWIGGNLPLPMLADEPMEG